MAPTSNEKFERTISDIEMWDHTRTLVPKSRNVLLLVAKPVGGYPALHYAHGTPTVQESQMRKLDILWWAMCLLLPLAGILGGKNTNTPGTRAQWTWAVAVLQFCSARPGTGNGNAVWATWSETSDKD
ncbi:hypothetical protein FOCG_01143 [Fusarium oxysporum f. sp. radicis-lycopersici 26381]|uniref:Uncharacterized protein n=1 Tax=Fusarium oxysporum Fo47 TaxID=660027 RepID=W9KR97_FUSOX|nr:hypothetical protein FOZG_05639 [Fusarium oxysporum Fo47]EXL62597.1 hypothetical protein FOCG_01143 [Fusarium oxysporum f. sp. radicis-lycopersici 26381]